MVRGDDDSNGIGDICGEANIGLCIGFLEFEVADHHRYLCMFNMRE